MTTERRPVLDEDDLQRINDALAQIEDVQDVLLRAKEAQIDVSREESELQQLRQRLLAIKRAFFPGR